MACGFVATSAAFVVMELAGVQGGDEGPVSVAWLSGCYVLLTLGELLLAPMGLALITRLAPSERASRMVALSAECAPRVPNLAKGNGTDGQQR